MIATTDPEKKRVYVFSDLPTGTVARLLRTVPGLREWGAPQDTVHRAPPSPRMPAAFPDTRPAAPAMTHTETTTHKEERVFMAGDSHGGGAKASPAWAETLLYTAIAIAVLVGSVIWFSNWVTGNTGGSRIVTIQDNRPIEYRVITPQGNTVVLTNPPASVTTTAPTARTSPTMTTRASSAPTSRLPTPEEVAARVTHTKTRTPVPCIEGYVKNDATGMCEMTYWVQD